MRTIAIFVAVPFAAMLGCASYGLDRREPNRSCVAPDVFPDDLADTGCFAADDPARAVEALVPFGVRVALWSDGAEKERFVALPDQTRIAFDDSGRAELPNGAVLAKIFRLDGRPIETRLLVRRADGSFAGATYVWSEDGAEARLHDGGPIERDGRAWMVPTRAQCFDCHDEDRGALGLELAQLDADFTYEATGRVANQLDTLEGIGLLEPLAARTPAYDPSDARAYLHVNCAHCHRPGGEGAGSFDLRFSTPEHLMNLCEERPERGDPTGADGRLIAPGSRERSVLYRRMESANPLWRMPYIGTTAPDIDGLNLVGSWIDSMADCRSSRGDIEH